jgi:uncharacterized membrane protein YhaH (DUF805 family)
MRYFFAALRKYANFRSRATREEFWWFSFWGSFFAIVPTLPLFVMAGVTLAAGGDGALPRTQLFLFLVIAYVAIYLLVTIVPATAVLVRRLHDTGRSGWWYFFGFVPSIGAPLIFVFCCLDGQPGENRYGPNPKEQPELTSAPPVAIAP